MYITLSFPPPRHSFDFLILSVNNTLQPSRSLVMQLQMWLYRLKVQGSVASYRSLSDIKHANLLGHSATCFTSNLVLFLSLDSFFQISFQCYEFVCLLSLTHFLENRTQLKMLTWKDNRTHSIHPFSMSHQYQTFQTFYCLYRCPINRSSITFFLLLRVLQPSITNMLIFQRYVMLQGRLNLQRIMNQASA